MARIGRRNLVLALCGWALLVVLGCAGAAFLVQREYQSARENTVRRAEAAANLAMQVQVASYESLRGVVNLLILRHRFVVAGHEASLAALDRSLETEVAEHRFGITALSLVAPDGRIYWSSEAAAIGLSIADRPYFRRLIDFPDGTVSLSEPLRAKVSGMWRIQVARPLNGPDGKLEAVALTTIDPLHLSDLLGAHLGAAGRFIAIRRLRDGALRAVSLAPEERLALPPQPNHPVVVAARQALAGNLEFTTSRGARRVIAAFRVFEPTGLVIEASFDRTLELAPFYRFAWLVGFGLAGAAVLGLGLAVFWARSVTLRRSLQLDATHDPLTNLKNRRAFTARTERLLASAQRTGEPLAFLLLDLDHFKQINDQHGHAAGDQVLQDVAEALGAGIRHSDLVCRWGGEEMLILLRSCVVGDALARAEALRTGIEALYSARQGPVPRVTASIGVACFPGDGSTLADLVDCADTALYAAKAGGRNRTTLGRPPLLMAAA